MRQILVVDNDLAVCQTIQGRLQNDVTKVCCISSLVEALSSYIRQDYCLAILDTQLSDCTYWQTAVFTATSPTGKRREAVCVPAVNGRSSYAMDDPSY